MNNILFKSKLQIALLIIILLFYVASSTSAYLSYFLLALYVFIGRAQAIFGLLLLWLLTMISPAIRPDDFAFAGIGRYLVFLSAALSIFLRNGLTQSKENIRVNKLVLLTLFFGCFIVIHSLLFSPIKDVSLLKGLSWLVVVSTLISAWASLNIEERKQVENSIFFFLIATMLISLPLLISPLGYLKNGAGFQGILNHPQVFGPTMALLGSWLLVKQLTSTTPSYKMLGLFCISFALVLASEARTAALAMILGAFAMVLSGIILKKTTPSQFMPGLRSKKIIIITSILLVAILLFFPVLSSKWDSFITKSNRAEAGSLTEVYDNSRGSLISQMIDNIIADPFKGVGFGIGSDPESMVIKRDSVIGLPLGAPIEKGVVFLAVFEELGVFGFLFCTFLLWLFIKNAALYGGAHALAVCFTAFFLNFGESTFFSPGGFGLLTLILITWAATFYKNNEGHNEA